VFILIFILRSFWQGQTKSTAIDIPTTKRRNTKKMLVIMELIGKMAKNCGNYFEFIWLISKTAARETAHNIRRRKKIGVDVEDDQKNCTNLLVLQRRRQR
jgi:hypothetical protein